MKKINIFLSVLGLLIFSLCLSACSEKTIDYVANLKLEASYENKEFFKDGIGEVSLYRTIDGDTAYFLTGGQEAKIRFVSVDTPESTGKIEPWGKAASDFTKNILTSAETIVLQSSTGTTPDADSTGSRYLAFVWYRTDANSDFRNLNLELIQHGYSINKSELGALYQDTFKEAGTQAMNQKLHVWSNDEDPDYDYSDGQALTVKEISLNPEPYLNKRVNFEAYVSRVYSSYCYLQNEVDGKTYGTVVYLGYDSNLTGNMSPFKVGNKVKVSGFVQQFNDTWQIAGCSYNAFYDGQLEKYPQYCHNLGTGNNIEPMEINGNQLNNGEELMRVLVKMNDLKVTNVYSSEDLVGDVVASEMTITCKTADNVEVQLRTGSLYKSSSEPLTEEDFKNAVLTSVIGIVDCYKGTYQIRLVSIDDIAFK